MALPHSLDNYEKSVLLVKNVRNETTNMITCRQKSQKIYFRMMFINPTTGWFEWTEVIDDKSSATILHFLDSVWLARYPRPRQVLYDNGSEFKKDFQPLFKDFAIKPKCTTIKNPLANSILKRILTRNYESRV